MTTLVESGWGDGEGIWVWAGGDGDAGAVLMSTKGGGLRGFMCSREGGGAYVMRLQGLLMEKGEGEESGERVGSKPGWCEVVLRQ